MKKIFFVIVYVLISNTYSQTDFILIVNNQTQEISLDKNYDFQVDGKTIQVSVKEKDTLIYNDPLHF